MIEHESEFTASIRIPVPADVYFERTHLGEAQDYIEIIAYSTESRDKAEELLWAFYHNIQGGFYDKGEGT